jgi:tetratricopeptide (TPR) repeat protein
LHRAVVSSGHPRPVFYHEWLHAAAHELDRDGIDAAIAAVQRLWPDDPATWYWVAFARAELGEVPAAFAALGEAIERAPDFVGARLNQARLLRRQGRVAEARDVLEKLLAIAPRRAALHHELGTTLGVLGEHAAAAASLEKALAATPEDRLLRREYAGALSSLGQHQQARRELERCLAIAPDAATWFALALERAGTGDAAGARAGYEAALRLDARHAPSLTNLALLDLRGGDPEAAEDRLQEALAADPGFVPARRALLRLFDARPAEAVAMCRDWVRHGPGVAEAWRHLAWSMVRSDAAELREEALAIARKADQMTGGADPPTRHVLAAALLWNGDASQALTIVQQALSALDPGDRFAPYYRELMQATEARCRRALDPGGRR